MMGSTHAVVGLALGLALMHQQPPLNAVALASLAGVAALLPDIDHPQAFMGRRLIVGRLFHHRGFTHSLLALALVALACLHYLPYPIASMIAVGYASHLVLDALNPQGIPLLYPVKLRMHVASFRTNGALDKLLGFCAACAVLVLIVRFW